MSWKFYKSGQGYYTRMGTAIAAVVIVSVGCWSLYKKLELIKTDAEWTAWLQAGIPAFLFVVLNWLVYKALNLPKFADFLIATEGEMKKVSWSSRKEVVASTGVVIVTVMLVGFLLMVVDMGFSFVFKQLGVLQF